MKQRETPFPTSHWGSRVAPDSELAEEAARILGAAPPRSELPEDVGPWIRATFTDSAAMLMWIAACELGQRGQVEDARALVGDACHAQRRNAPTGKFSVAPLSGPRETRDFSEVTARIELLDGADVDIVVEALEPERRIA